jgi:predicted Zn-dependent peptidase
LPDTPPPANQALRVVLVDKPGAVQTVVRFVMPAPKYSSPQREGLLSFGTILGGSFTSRLNQNLREAKGYTYGAGARYSPGPTIGTFIASADVRTDVTGASIQEFLNEFKKIGAGDISDTEATKAAATRRADLVSELGTLPGLLATAEEYDLNGRPFTAISGDIKSMTSLSAGDINRLAASAVALNKGVLVLVGDKATILKQLSGLDLPTPVEVKAP